MMKRRISKKLLSIGLSLTLCATAVPMVSLTSSAAGTATPKIAVGRCHTVVLKSDGSVWATGKNDYGQLGVGKTKDELAKTATFTPCIDDTGAEIKDAIDIACGNYHTAVIRAGGALWQCGNNSYGKLGTGDTTDVNKFVQSGDANGAITDAEAVSCGGDHTAVIRSNKTLWQCGNNSCGQLGTWDANINKFVQSEDDSGAIADAMAVACGMEHTAVIRAGGALWQCGRNDYGQLGTGERGNNTSKTKFVQSKDENDELITDAEEVSCGWLHTAVIRAGRALWQCGGNDIGQLGTGDGGTRTKFVQSKDENDELITDAEEVSCGWMYTAVIRSNKALWQCGDNYYGELGTGDTTNVSKFVQSQDASGAITNVVAISNGGQALATLILSPDANGDLELLGTGINENGELGLGEDSEDAYTNQTKFIRNTIADIGKMSDMLAGDTLTAIGQTANHSVTGVGEFQGSTSITIAWGDLTYDYNAKWDPATQTWVQKGDTPYWKTSADGADKISVTNDSSKAYSVTLSFAVDNAYAASDENGTAVEGSFVTTSFGDTAVENNTLKLPVAAKDVTAYLKLSGMSDKVTGVESLQNQTFGVVTATLAEAQ